MPKTWTEGDPERRGEACGDTCVKGDFATVKKLVFMILGAYILTTGYNVYASSDDEVRITAVEIKQENVIEKIDDMDEKIDRLLDLATQTNIVVQTHIAGEHN